jgi:hypothetical protein
MESKASGKSNWAEKRAGTGRQPQNRFRWLRLGLLNVVFLIAPFGAWYIMQVQNTLETNTIRTFRALNEVDTALVDIVNNLPKIWEFSEKVQPYRQALSEADKNYKNTKGEEAIFLCNVIDEAKEIEDENVNGEAEHIDDENEESPGAPSERNNRLPYESVIRLNPALKSIQFPDETITAQTLDACIENDRKRLLIDRSLGQFWAQAICLEAERVPTLVQAPLNDLLGSVVKDVSARFDHVMLAAGDGAIVSQVATRRPEATKTSGAIATDPFRYDYFNYSNLRPILENSEDCVEEASQLYSDSADDGGGGPTPLAHAMTCKIHVGKTRFVLFIQPSELDIRRRTGTGKAGSGQQPPASAESKTRSGTTKADGVSTQENEAGDAKPDERKACLENAEKVQNSGFGDEVNATRIPGERTSWYVIGVVRDSSQLGRAFIAPISITGPVLLLIIIALAGLPLLWLSTKSRRSLLTTVHFTFALGGGIIILALSTTLILHSLYERDLNRQTDRSIVQLNEWISYEFTDEIRNRVESMNQVLRSPVSCPKPDQRQWPVEPDVHSFPPYEARMVLGRKSTADSREYKTGVTICDIQSYRHYSAKSGQFETRQYYQRPAAGEAWSIEREPGSSEFMRFYIERVRSFIDGSKVAALAVPYPDDSVLAQGTSSPDVLVPEVLVDIQPIHSLFKAALPPHHSFAVIESGSGRVLFHSSDNRSLDENFIDETDGDLELISVVQSRGEALLKLQYHGRSIRAFAAPMENVPWMLITFVDDEIIDTVLLESLITTAGLVVTYAFLLMLLFWAYATLVEANSDHRKLAWLWPVTQHSPHYLVVIYAVAALSILFIVALMVGTVDHNVIHGLFAIGLLAMLVALRSVYVFTENASKTGHREHRGFGRRAAAIVLFALFVLIVVSSLDSAGSLLLCGVFLLVIGGAGAISYHLEKPGSGPRDPENQGTSSDHRSSRRAGEGRPRKFLSTLPLLAFMTFVGPVAGMVVYLSVFDAFSDHYSRYADHQILRALDLRERELRNTFKRYFAESERRPEFSLGKTGNLNSCRGNYLSPGPFMADFDPQSSPKERSCIVDEFLEKTAYYAGCCPKSDQSAANYSSGRIRNWVSVFVQKMPVFSYESGAIKQAYGDELDAGRLRWCACEKDGTAVPWFVGESAIQPKFQLSLPASDLEYKRLSARDARDDGEGGAFSSFRNVLRWFFSASVVVILIVFIQFWIARTINNHLFGGHIRYAEPERIVSSDLDNPEDQALLVISPVRIFDHVAKKFDNPRIFSPQNWNSYRDEQTGLAKEKLDFKETDVLIVDETEDIFGVSEQRIPMLGTIEQALNAGARIILLTRVDPNYWLDMLDSRSMSESRTMSIDQTEVIVWESLLRKFKIGLFPGAVSELHSSIEESREHAQNWAVSTPEERNVLANLAISDLYNPDNVDVIRSLIQRGLVTADQPHRIREKGFKTYIRHSTELQALSDWRREGSDSLWAAIWPTLLVVIGLLVFFVVSAGQNTVKSAMAIIGSIVAALPVLMSVVAFMRSSRASGR